MKGKIILMVLAILLVSSCKIMERKIKDVESSFTGISRHVTVYTHNGDLLREYKGVIDLEVSETPNKVKFEIDKKRVIVYNAIVVVEEN